MSSEKWLVISDYPDYKISTEGRVFSMKSNKELKQGIGNKGYYYINLSKHGRVRRFYIHRLVAGTFFEEDITNQSIDHIDGKTQNNFILNLRVCNHQQNHFNRGKNKNNTSGFKGVSWDKQKQKWVANLHINSKKKCLGYFTDKEAVYEAYKQASKSYHKEFSYQYL